MITDDISKFDENMISDLLQSGETVNGVILANKRNWLGTILFTVGLFFALVGALVYFIIAYFHGKFSKGNLYSPVLNVVVITDRRILLFPASGSGKLYRETMVEIKTDNIKEVTIKDKNPEVAIISITEPNITTSIGVGLKGDFSLDDRLRKHLLQLSN